MRCVIVSEGIVFLAGSEREALTCLTKQLKLDLPAAERLISKTATKGEARLIDKKAGKAIIMYITGDFGTAFAYR